LDSTALFPRRSATFEYSIASISGNPSLHKSGQSRTGSILRQLYRSDVGFADALAHLFVVSRNVADSSEWRSSSAGESRSQSLLIGALSGANSPVGCAFNLQFSLFARLRKGVSRADSLPDVLESLDSPFETQELDRINTVSDTVRPPLSVYGM
jgi:hypothetical protein